MNALVIVFHSDVNALERCLDSTGPIDCLVVDTSYEGTAEGTSIAHDCTYLSLPSNPGYAAALNRAIRLLPDADVVVCSNADIIYDPVGLKLIQTAAAERSGIAFPIQVGTWTSSPHSDSLMDQLSIIDCARRWLVLDRRWARRRRAGWIANLRSSGETLWFDGSLYSGSGASFAIARSAWIRIGQFPETFFLQEEDRLMCHLAALREIPTGLVGAATVVHYGGMRSQRPTVTQLVSRRRLELQAFNARLGHVPFAVQLITKVGFRLRVVRSHW